MYLHFRLNIDIHPTCFPSLLRLSLSSGSSLLLLLQLILDLDETLVHSSFKPVPGADYIIDIDVDNTFYKVRGGGAKFAYVELDYRSTPSTLYYIHVYVLASYVQASTTSSASRGFSRALRMIRVAPLIVSVRNAPLIFRPEVPQAFTTSTATHSIFRALSNASDIFAKSHAQVFVLKRPGVDEFLERMAKTYEVIVFTASLPQYANPLLDLVRLQ